ncbi:hypothetical protein OSTOST_23083 [Ostertagia ostertagi]
MWVLAVVAVLIVVLAYEWIRKVRRYPPALITTLSSPFKEYGNVITIWLGPLPTVHILDFETAKEEMLTNGAAYVDRYAPYMIDVRREGRGTVFSSGEFWADHRRFTLRTLRDFALKNSIMEERIMSEVQSK